MSNGQKRSDVDERYKWDLTALFGNDDEWEAAYEATERAIDDLRAFEGRVDDDPKTLYEAVRTYEEVMSATSDLAEYAKYKRDEDRTEDRYQALAARARSLSVEARSVASAIKTEIRRLDRETLEAYVAEYPPLDTYEHYLENLVRKSEHRCSSEVESFISDLGSVIGSPGEIYNHIASLDIEFPAVEDTEGAERDLTLGNFTTLQRERDRQFRQAVYEAFYDEWGSYRNAIAAAYRNSVKADVKLARARGYETARAAALDGPNLPVTVYDTLLETIGNNVDVLQRHVDLKRAAIDVDELHMWDLYVPFVDEEGPEIGYEEACGYIVDAVAPLGEEYQSHLEAGLDSRWVDVYETEYKRSGAYTGGTYESQPYVLLNYQNDVSSMYTLAHELGHAMHSELTRREQPYIYSNNRKFVAEVASTVNETLLTHYLLDASDDDQFRRHVLNQYLEQLRTTLFRQTLLAEFEHEVHRLAEAGKPLTADRLEDRYREIKTDYYANVVADDRIAREWMRVSHLFKGFNVYQYATGISAAVALARDVLGEGRPAARRYREFLASGSSRYPLDLLKDAGVDMTTIEPIQSTVDVYGEYLDEFERLT